MSCKKKITIKLDSKVKAFVKLDSKVKAVFKTCIKIQDVGGSAFSKGFSLGFKS